MGAGRTKEIPVGMLKTATNMIGRMSPDELQNMIKNGILSPGGEPAFSDSPFEPNFRPGSAPPNLSPNLLKTAGKMMSKMPPDELQKLFEMASSLNPRDSVPSLSNVRVNSESRSKLPESKGTSAVRNNVTSERGGASSSFPDVGSTS